MKIKRHRGISLGTILMAGLAVLVLAGTLRVLRSLSGDADLHLAERLNTLEFSEVLPERKIDDIPIQRMTETSQAPLVSVVAPTPAPVGGQVHLTFAGTIAAETAVRQSGYYSDTKRYDFSEILSLLKDDLQSDFSMAVMENLVIPDAKVSDLIVPEPIMGMLTSGGLNGVALGFGKIYDKGFSGLNSTVQAAQGRGLQVLGAYTNEGEAALSNRIMEFGNIRVAILHYTESLSSAGGKSLRKDGNGFAVPLLEQAEKDIALVRSMGAQAVVVSVNWGTAGKTAVSSSQKKIAEKLCSAGADVIIGNGPRRVQKVERISGKTPDGQECTALCAYSLGCMLSSSTTASALQSILLHVDITVDEKEKVSVSASYTPVFIWRYKQENVIRFRTIAANGVIPDGMTSEQQKKMAAAAASVEQILKDAAASPRN